MIGLLALLSLVPMENSCQYTLHAVKYRYHEFIGLSAQVPILANKQVRRTLETETQCSSLNNHSGF